MKKLAPTPKLAIGAYIAYLVVFYGIWIINGIDYPNIGHSADTLLKWYVAPLLGGTAVLAILTTLFGWWKAVLFETDTQRVRNFYLLYAPIIMIIGVVGSLIMKDFSNMTPLIWTYLTIGSLLVGFNEELLTRGLLVTAFREKYSEKKVWLYSTLLFSLIHLANGFFGVGVKVVGQLVITFILGSALYMFRRYTGVIVAAMLLHGAWDFVGFAGKDTSASQIFMTFIIVGVTVGVFVTVRHLFKKPSRPQRI